MAVELRPSNKTFGETGPTGDTTREEKGYEIGAEIDGVWVPFASVGQGQLDHAKQRQEAAEAAAGKTTKAKASESKPTDAK